MQRKSNDGHSERQAKCIVRDVESRLRKHLGVEKLDSDFVADLYVRILEELRARSADENDDEDFMSSLALTVYFVVASRPGVSVWPDLIPHVRKVIARSLTSMGSANSIESSGGQKDVEHDE